MKFSAMDMRNTFDRYVEYFFNYCFTDSMGNYGVEADKNLFNSGVISKVVKLFVDRALDNSENSDKMIAYMMSLRAHDEQVLMEHKDEMIEICGCMMAIALSFLCMRIGPMSPYFPKEIWESTPEDLEGIPTYLLESVIKDGQLYKRDKAKHCGLCLCGGF